MYRKYMQAVLLGSAKWSILWAYKLTETFSFQLKESTLAKYGNGEKQFQHYMAFSPN